MDYSKIEILMLCRLCMCWGYGLWTYRYVHVCVCAYIYICVPTPYSWEIPYGLLQDRDSDVMQALYVLGVRSLDLQVGLGAWG
jgi:hypothetical protein